MDERKRPTDRRPIRRHLLSLMPAAQRQCVRVAVLAVGAVLATISGPAAAMSDGAVRIMVLTNMEGTYSELAGQGDVIAAEMAAEKLGDTAGGAPVKILVRDSKLDPKRAVQLLETANEKEHVDMVTGPIASNVGLAVQNYAEKHGIITLHSGPSSSQFTGESCSPLAVQWGFNTYALAHASGAATVRDGGDKWYFLTADYNFGHDLQKQVSGVVKAEGGRVLGASVVPYPATDMTEELKKAAASGANVVGLANAGEDTQLAIRQGFEVGLGARGINLVAIEFYISDIRRLGVYVTAGLRYATSFYWNRDATSRAWSDAFRARYGLPPTSPMAGVYSATLHYLKAVDALANDEASQVMSKMRATTVDDGVFTSNGHIRSDGRMMHDMLLVEVKQPAEVKRAGDNLNVRRVIPASDAFRPLDRSPCPLARRN